MNKYLIIDTETGGLEPSKHSLLEFAAILADDKFNIDATFSTPIKSKDGNYVVSAKALEVNGMSLDHIDRYGNTPDIIASQLDFLLRGEEQLTVVGHNISFDLQFIEGPIGEVIKKHSKRRPIDTSAIASFLISLGHISPKSGSLQNLADYFDIKRDAQHRALSDAKTTLSLLQRFACQIKFQA